jgi:endonuclease-3
MDEEERTNQILRILEERFGVPKWTKSTKEPFPTLIRTVLSQATNDRNRDRAYKNLSQKYEITPKTLANSKVKEIEEAIKVGGLHRNKSKKIKELSRVVQERFNGSLDFVYSTPIEQARVLLMSIPGVGPKTADVVLLFSAKRPLVPIDTHVHRVSRRLGLAPIKGNYEEIRRSIESVYSPSNYLAIHLLLINLGRTYCRARNPLHKPCPVNSLCPTAQLEARQPDLHSKHGSRDYP